jgi:transcriptional regulator with XRE-family HTH domain
VRRPSIRELEELAMKDRMRAIRGRDTQKEFSARTGFSTRQIKRWESGDGTPAWDSAEDLSATTGYPARIFLPPPEPTLTEIGEKLDLVLSLLQSRNGRR